MKKVNLNPPSRLSSSTHQRLQSYAIAAATTGVSALVLTPSAAARIVYTPTHKVLTRGTLPIPVGHTNFFTLTDKFYIITGSWSSQFLNIKVSGSAAVVGAKGSALALHAGKVIGPRDAFQAGKELMAGAFCETQISSSRVFGHFANTAQRYLGLKFKLNGKFHYGWARFGSVKASACNGGPAVSAVLTGYAYETIPGKAIIAGATAGPEDAEPSASLSTPAPEPATLGVLARGALGLSIWRREELLSTAA